MIQTELRIVNYILSEDVCGKKNEVKLDSELFIYYLNEANFKLHKLNPIPLNEEWLKRFMFENYDDLNLVYIKNSIQISREKGFYWYKLINGDEIEVTYVHQLQNLYFALTGEELTIKGQ